MVNAPANVGNGDPPPHAQALLDFAAASKTGALPGAGQEVISEELNGIIRQVAETGAANSYPWDALRHLLARKVELVLAEFWLDFPDYPLAREGESFAAVAVEPLTKSLLEPLRKGPPFTLQRICELLANPRQIYKSTKRYFYALQRVILVAMTEDVLTPDTSPQLPMQPALELAQAQPQPQPAVAAPQSEPDVKGADLQDIADCGDGPENGTVAGKKRKLPEEAANGVVADD